MASDPIKSGLNWYAYAESNPSTYWDANGLWTFAFGGEVALNILYLEKIGGGGGLVIDGHGNVGLYWYPFGGGGSYTAGKFFDVGLSGTFSITTADTIFDLQGWGTSVGVSVTLPEYYGLTIGIDYTFGATDSAPIHGITVSVGVAIKAPLDFHTSVSYTHVEKLFSIPEIRDNIYNQVRAYYYKFICERIRQEVERITDGRIRW